MITTFTIDTNEGKVVENLKSLQDFLTYNPVNVYETTFGEKQLLLRKDNPNEKYSFNFTRNYFSLEALLQLQEIDNTNKILCGTFNLRLIDEISIIRGEKCSIEIGIPLNVRKGRGLAEQRKNPATTFKDILKKL